MNQAIIHPVYRQAQKRASNGRRQQQERKLLNCGTRELKMRIAMLDAMLKVPFEHEAATRDQRERSRMGAQLQVYRRELERRDARDQVIDVVARPVAPANLANSLNKLKARFH